MIDIHCHILQEIDDGSTSIEESLELLKGGEKLGFKTFVLTAHYHRERGYFCEGYNEKFQRLRKRVLEEGLNIELLRGSEIFLDENYREILETFKWESIDGSKNILVEVSPLEIPEVTLKKIEVIVKRGYVPILAHCERYINFKLRDYRAIKKLGGYLQVNIGSMGKKKNLIKELIKYELIDFLGSDVHRIKGRNYELQRELKTFRKLMGREYFNRVTLKKEKRDEEKESSFIDLFINMWKGLFRRDRFRGNIKSS